jgi:nitroimidazol reductase NimA-like FMN-containing flavoprotein (pyridoxamine 5'-phosphate oxidase superfamily)
MSEPIKRPRNYSKISISEQEAEHFLDSQVWIRVATIDSSTKEIWNLPTHYVRIGNDIYFDESPDSIMLQNLSSNPQCCAVADTGYSYDDLVGVIIQGEAEIENDRETLAKYVSMVEEKYKMLTRRPPLQDFAARKLVRLKPSAESINAVTWDFGKGHL